MEKHAQMAAWAGSPEEALRFVRGEIPMNHLVFTDPTAEMVRHGWARVGTVNAEVVDLKSEDLMVQEAIAALKARRNKIYADAEESAQAIEVRIQRLLAIEDKSKGEQPSVHVDENGNEVFAGGIAF